MKCKHAFLCSAKEQEKNDKIWGSDAQSSDINF